MIRSSFSEAVASKEIQYVQKIELDDDEKRDLGRKLDVLHNLTWNGRMARANRVMVTVKYFIPCVDRDSFSFGTKGQYKELQGMVLRVDTDVELTLALQTETGKVLIAFDDILEITSRQEIYDTDWELEAP